MKNFTAHALVDSRNFKIFESVSKPQHFYTRENGYNVIMDSRSAFNDFIQRVSNALFRSSPLNEESAVNTLLAARERGGFVWLVGNGGSAATASHFANDLEKMCGIRAIAVPDMVSVVTAYGNDDGWDKMFARVIESQAGDDDVLVAFSCSGESENVRESVKLFLKGQIIVFTGDNRESSLCNGLRAASILFVEDTDIKVQETVHLALCHAIVEVLKRSAT